MMIMTKQNYVYESVALFKSAFLIYFTDLCTLMVDFIV